MGAGPGPGSGSGVLGRGCVTFPSIPGTKLSHSLQSGRNCPGNWSDLESVCLFFLFLVVPLLCLVLLLPASDSDSAHCLLQALLLPLVLVPLLVALVSVVARRLPLLLTPQGVLMMLVLLLVQEALVQQLVLLLVQVALVQLLPLVLVPLLVALVSVVARRLPLLLTRQGALMMLVLLLVQEALVQQLVLLLVQVALVQLLLLLLLMLVAQSLPALLLLAAMLLPLLVLSTLALAWCRLWDPMVMVVATVLLVAWSLPPPEMPPKEHQNSHQSWPQA